VWSLPIFVPFTLLTSTHFYLQRSIFFMFFYLLLPTTFHLFLTFLLPIFVLFISIISLLSSTYNTVVFNFSLFSFLPLLSSTNNNVVFNFYFLSLSFFMFLLYPSVCLHTLYFLTILYLILFLFYADVLEKGVTFQA
jgi:hypothetical protein